MTGFTPGTRGASPAEGKSRFHYVGLGGLALLIVLLVFLAWQVAEDPGGQGSVDTRSQVPQPPRQADGEDPTSEKAWDERVAQWKQMLKESSAKLDPGKRPSEAQGSAQALSATQGTPSLPARQPSGERDPVDVQRPGAPARIPAGKTFVVDVLEGVFERGESIEVVWCSPDGTEWKRVIDRPLIVEGIDKGAVRVSVKEEEARRMRSARVSGKVFAVPW